MLAYQPMIWKMAKRLFPSTNIDSSIIDKNEESQFDLVQNANARAIAKWEMCRDGFVNWLRFIVLAEYQNMRTAIRNGSHKEDINDERASLIEIGAIGSARMEIEEALKIIPHPREHIQSILGYTYKEIGKELGVSAQVILNRLRANEKALKGMEQ